MTAATTPPLRHRRRSSRRPGAVEVVLVAVIAVALVVAAVSVVSQISQDAPAPQPDQEFSSGTITPTPADVVPLPLGGWATNAAEADDGADDGTISAQADTLSIPSLDIVAPVDVTAIANGELDVPDDVGRVTRFAGGAAPGDPNGTVLIAGHVDSASKGRGALWPLHQIAEGTLIVVVGDDGVAQQYQTVGLVSSRKRRLPDTMFSSAGPPRLTIVTCGGEIVRTDAGARYEDNVIATALPIGAPRSPVVATG